jgi:hypothetical protein
LLLSIFLFFKFYFIISGSKDLALWCTIGLLIYIIVSFEQEGDRIGKMFLVRIVEDKGFVFLCGSPLFGILSIRSLIYRRWRDMLLLLVVGSFFSLSHPLSVFWLGPIYFMAVVPYAIFNKVERPLFPLSISLCVLILGAAAAYHQYALINMIEMSSQDYFQDLQTYLTSSFSRRNVVLPLSDVTYILHPRFISDRFSLLCLAFIPLLFYKYNRNSVEFFYGFYTTIILLIISFTPPLINLVNYLIPLKMIDRILWNLPLPLVFGMGMYIVVPYIQKKINSFSNSKWIRKINYLGLICVFLLFLSTRSTYYRLVKIVTKEQQISNVEIEFYSYLNTLDLIKGTRIWLPNTPKKLGDYLPAFVYGVYPFSFRGEFDNRLELPEDMESSGSNRPDYLFYSALSGKDTGDIPLDCGDLLELYMPDYVVIPNNIINDLEFLNKLGYKKVEFNNAKYALYRSNKGV